MALSTKYLLIAIVLVLLFSSHAHAFGAGNIASISAIEGKNWRHGDIEDMLKTVAFIKHHKWSSMMIKRVYFGNWLRDYSQAMDVATLKGVPKDTIRVLVWILAFMSFGYATAEFEVTEERLGVYRPEEHIDNPRDYADNIDARQYDQRLRPPVRKEELDIDPQTGMKNYIANEHGDWATSLAYVKTSFTRAIQYGRQYCAASGMFSHGNEADLCEALRCLGQGLHCLEDFGAHSNYTELALREMGFNNVFTHVGVNTEVELGGKRVFPLVTGTFGGVDFLHSVLGEATDHVTQSEVDQLKRTMEDARSSNAQSGGSAEQEISGFTDLLSKIPGTGDLCREAVNLQRSSDQQAEANSYTDRDAQRMTMADVQNFDAKATVAKIYPILEFRDKVVRAINKVVSMIPGLEEIVEKIQETITLFIMGLLAPYITPLINTAMASLKTGSTTVIDSSARHQYEPWTDPNCTDPTHSLLSKDHFSNILNQPAGNVASQILQYCAPRVLYAWDHPDVPIEQIMSDISRVFHHPTLRDRSCELQQKMFGAVESWVHALPDRGSTLNNTLSSESVKAGGNHSGGVNPHLEGGGGHAHAPGPFDSKMFGLGNKISAFGGVGGGGQGQNFPGQQGEYSTSSPYPQQQLQPNPSQYDNFAPAYGENSQYHATTQGYAQASPAQNYGQASPPSYPPQDSSSGYPGAHGHGAQSSEYPGARGRGADPFGGQSYQPPSSEGYGYPPQASFEGGENPPQQYGRPPYGGGPYGQPPLPQDPNTPYPPYGQGGQGWSGGY